ncbi:hypothetical protein [Mucilaginibacter sp. L196]|uniref:hypothetical protein n=1 Tax=Mucilaginibacter sp. L196 TaxID=1641870 RepID=UPI00131B1F93|nr:hypothetical protein [Mucilaginibacter sp. L196]
MKKVKIIATALIATCAFEYAVANTYINSSVRVISHKDYALRDTVPVTSGSGSKTPTTTPMPTTTPTTTPMPTTTPSPMPSPTVPPASTPATPTPTPTSVPTPTAPTGPPVK